MPVTPILFAIYLSGVFQNVQEIVITSQATSLTHNCGFLVEAQNITELIERTENAGNTAIEWEGKNCLQFDHAKIEAVVFTKRRKINLR